jgi:hypothetical protein
VKIIECISWRVLGFAVLFGCIVVSLALNISLSGRVVILEAANAKRDLVDPLMPIECTLGDDLGQSSDRPCFVEFYRLHDTPQQFEGRWVGVKGNYVSGFEMSAFFPDSKQLDQKKGKDLQTLDIHSAMWLSPGFSDGEQYREIYVIGKFHRGPAGHLGAYFGELEGAILR